MRYRWLVSICASNVLLLVLSNDPSGLLAQAPSSAKPGSSWSARTPDGQFDLEGVWDFGTITPLERPSGLVTLLVEMVHDVRVVPVDGRPRLPSAIRQYKGDSRGRWEGRTLVIDTTNFLRETSFRGSSANLHLVERLTRIDANTLLYEFTVNDPKTWTKPWTAAIPMKKVDAPIYEYACHEGNYALRNILAGARAQEK